MNQFRRVGVTAAFVISSPIYIAACGWMSSSQSTASLSTESIPQSTQMQMLTAQVKGNTQGIRGLLISSNEHLKNMDLSNSFYAETGSERQLLGTVTSNSKVPHSLCQLGAKKYNCIKFNSV
jgi:hypothetical protein